MTGCRSAAGVFEDANKVIVRTEAPGMRRETFKVELHGDLLTVRGEKQFEKEVSAGQCAYGSSRRDVILPTSVKPDDARAIYRDGVLRIELPKSIYPVPSAFWPIRPDSEAASCNSLH